MSPYMDVINCDIYFFFVSRCIYYYFFFLRCIYFIFLWFTCWIVIAVIIYAVLNFFCSV